MTEPSTEPEPPRGDGSRIIWQVRFMPQQEQDSPFSPGEPAPTTNGSARKKQQPAEATE